MTILDSILAEKRLEVGALKADRTPSSFASERFSSRTPVDLAGAIGRECPPAVIAEIKKASPSAGILNDRVRVPEVAAGYAGAGAAAISVLTDARFFGGDVGDLVSARQAVDLPILRKDFVIDPIQVHQSRAIGADAILLIAAALDPAELADLHELAGALSLSCLVEVHSPAELDRLDFSKVRIVGINNRDLRDLSIDTGTTGRIARLLPPGVAIVSESGLRTARDVRQAASAGAHAVLMGEHFMRSDDPARALRELCDELSRD